MPASLALSSQAGFTLIRLAINLFIVQAVMIYFAPSSGYGLHIVVASLAGFLSQVCIIMALLVLLIEKCRGHHPLARMALWSSHDLTLWAINTAFFMTVLAINNAQLLINHHYGSYMPWVGHVSMVGILWGTFRLTYWLVRKVSMLSPQNRL